MTADRVAPHVTCLGCGCACDDIDVSIRHGRIVDTARACAIGAAWFGDASAPAEVLIDGLPGDLEADRRH